MRYCIQITDRHEIIIRLLYMEFYAISILLEDIFLNTSSGELESRLGNF